MRERADVEVEIGAEITMMVRAARTEKEMATRGRGEEAEAERGKGNVRRKGGEIETEIEIMNTKEVGDLEGNVIATETGRQFILPCHFRFLRRILVSEAF